MLDDGYDSAKLAHSRKLAPACPTGEYVAHESELYQATGASYSRQRLLTSLPLLVGDLLAIGLSLVVTYTVVFSISGNLTAELASLPPVFAVMMLLVFAFVGLYPGAGLHPVVELRKVVLATVLLFVSACANYASVTALVLGLASLSSVVLVPLFRSTTRRFCSQFSWWGERLLIFGEGDAAYRLYRHFQLHRRLGFRPIHLAGSGIAADGPASYAAGARRANLLAALRDEHQAWWAALTAPLLETSDALVRDYLAVFPNVLVLSDHHHLPCPQHQMFDCGGYSAILMTNRLLQPLPRLVKRSMDYMLVVIGGTLSLPLILLIALLVKLTSPGPVFYAQVRIGKNQRRFRAWKFRTMRVDADQVLQKHLDERPDLREEWQQNHKLKNDPRVTGIGRLLRQTSLDELPQLWNIVRGEMSLVGPRPIVVAEVSRYQDAFAYYVRATPGITGLWQISGRNNTTYEDRIDLDTRYVLNWSPWLDIYILLRTIKVVLLQEGAY